MKPVSVVQVATAITALGAWPVAIDFLWSMSFQKGDDDREGVVQVATAIAALEGRLKAIRKNGERFLTDKEELALQLNQQYPQDVGVLAAFFLNLVKLQAGQVCSPHVSKAHEMASRRGLAGLKNVLQDSHSTQ